MLSKYRNMIRSATQTKNKKPETAPRMNHSARLGPPDASSVNLVTQKAYET